MKLWLFLKVLLFSVFVPGTVAFYLPYRILNATGSPAWNSSAWRLPALLLIAAGASIYLRCAWDFAATGAGTPAPIDAPKRLVVAGLYRYTRNPMYLGVGSVILGAAWFFGSLVLLGYLAVVLLTVNAFVLLYEEPTLKSRFGADYDAYCKAVPRWFVRLHPWNAGR